MDANLYPFPSLNIRGAPGPWETAGATAMLTVTAPVDVY